MTEGSCHCGNVRFKVTERPDWLTDCNCSICRRYGALWAHFEIDRVQVEAAPEATIAYVHGDRLLAFHTCRQCGCTTHWENLGKDESNVMAVNFRMCLPEVVTQYRIRRFDGADTWSFVD